MTLTCFHLYRDENLTPLFSHSIRSITDVVHANSFCAYDPSTNVLYYGQEEYKCPEELMLAAVREGQLMSRAEYYTKHQEHLAKQYPDAPVLCTIDTTSTPEKTPGMSRLAALGVKITRN